MFNVNKDDVTPMMKQYLAVREELGDAILFYQLGDFYEMFFDDAVTASKVLDLTLTGRDCGLPTRAPMCGIPVHAVDGYVSKLVQAGHKVAICSQINEPSGKELVKRNVVRIVTPGTITENIDEKTNNYILSICYHKEVFGVAYADVSTGALYLSEALTIKDVEDLLIQVRPSEIITNTKTKEYDALLNCVKANLVPRFNIYADYCFDATRAKKACHKHFGVVNLSVYDITDENMAGICAVGGLLEYLNETQKRSLANINKIVYQKQSSFMHLDANTRRNLEIVENMSTKKKKGSLLGLLDKTRTSMGARFLKTCIEQPLQDSLEINSRLDAVEELLGNVILRSEMTEILNQIFDIERLTGKIAYGTITPKDCNTLSQSLKNASALKFLLDDKVKSPLLRSCVEKIVDTSEVFNLLDSAIRENAPVSTKEGGYIKPGYNDELDVLFSAGTLGKQWLAEYETKMKEQFGIKNLKVSYNRVFGYFIEVTKSQISLVPEDWVRRQTTANSERYITEELKEMEDKIMNSESRSLKLEAELYTKIREFLVSKISELQSVALAVSYIDTLLSFAVVSDEYNYCKPEINDSLNCIEIIDGRHPVVESLLKNGEFVPNDTVLNNTEDTTLIITGPNMAGKSTYMRQVAIITLIAHVGCFVPARKAKIAITDRIFTRIGASDDLTTGQSTFMVEMTEVSNIINNATGNSLLILDEIGRGTSTYDGLSIAWAVLEYIATNIKAKTLFATHYHELTDLEGKIDGVKNYRVLIKEVNNDIVFLHKIARGSANKSFGIEVAKMSGLPACIINKAKEILTVQEEFAESNAKIDLFKSVDTEKKTKNNINVDEVINVLAELDMNTVSPLIAFSTLQNLVDKVKKDR